MRARGYITADVRNQTEYGTVRGYIAVGLNTTDVGLQVASLVDSANRAFVQWAGMTAGLSQSFFDFYSVPAMQYRGGYLPASDTGDGGWWVWAYTAQFGGGFSGTISAEARRTTQIIDANCLASIAATCGTTTPGGFPAAATASGVAVAGSSSLFPGVGAYGGQQVTDTVANLRVDQAWGGAQIMGALHEVNASYYSTTAAADPCQLGSSERRVGLGCGRWLEDQYALHHPRRLVPGAGQRHARCATLPVQYPEHQLGYGTRHRRRLRQRGLRRAHRLRVRWHGGWRYYDELPADLGLGLQRRLRALLDPGVAHQLVRRLVPGEVRFQRQCDAVLA